MKKIGKDKWKHFYVGLFLGALFQWLLYFIFNFSPFTSIAFSFVTVAAIAYGFELFSLITGFGHYDIYDAVASVIGGIIGQALLFPAIF